MPFPSRRRFLAAIGIYLFLLGDATVRDSPNNDAKRLTASSRLEVWRRCFWETTLRTPSLFICVGQWFQINFFWSSERHGELATSNHRVTRVLTLFTFCPPGPLLREYENFSSFSGMERLSEIFVCDVIPLFPMSGMESAFISVLASKEDPGATIGMRGYQGWWISHSNK